VGTWAYRLGVTVKVNLRVIFLKTEPEPATRVGREDALFQGPLYILHGLRPRASSVPPHRPMLEHLLGSITLKPTSLPLLESIMEEHNLPFSIRLEPKVLSELIVVTNPDLPTLATTLRTFRAAQRYRIPIAGVVVNKIMKEKYEVPLSEIKRTLTYPVVGTIPYDEKVPESVAAGIPVINYAKCPASKKLREMGENLLKRWKS